MFTSRSAQSKTLEAKYAFAMSEGHFDLLPGRDDIDLSAFEYDSFNDLMSKMALSLSSLMKTQVLS